jgi:hypothetical protein
MWHNMTAHQWVSGPPTRLTTFAAGGRSMATSEVAAHDVLHQCKSCGRGLNAADFYASNKTCCKDCVRAKVRENRAQNRDYYQAYDRSRYRSDPKRKDNAKACASSPAGAASRKRSLERMKAEHPERIAARTAVGNAIRDGRLARGTECFFCGSQTAIQAHHHDYSKPLDVHWLCSTCHGKLHAVNGDFRRGVAS